MDGNIRQKMLSSTFQNFSKLLKLKEKKNPLQIIIKDSKKMNEYTHIDNIFS